MRGIEPIASWLDERLGVAAIGRALFARKIPAGTGWIYTLGSITLFLFVLQLATGTLLATSYAPTPDHAFDSVRYITEDAPFGSFLRGLHVWGATVMVVAVLLHALRTFVTGSYKFPRELTWMSGVLLIMLVLGFGFTGYLLPWNQKAYWATQVGTCLAEQVPLLGPAIARLLLGGDELGPQTLVRFYAIHVLVLPAIVVSLIAAHLFMVVRQGISAPPRRGEATAIASDRAEDRQRALAEYARQKDGGRSFYPYTLAKDAVAIFLVFALVALLAWHFAPEVGEIADAAETSFNPRPEWYFLWLFQFLKYFPGNLEVLGAVVLPAMGFALLFALPFLDRSRLPTCRWLRPLRGVRASSTSCTASPVTACAGGAAPWDPISPSRFPVTIRSGFELTSATRPNSCRGRPCLRSASSMTRSRRSSPMWKSSAGEARPARTPRSFLAATARHATSSAGPADTSGRVLTTSEAAGHGPSCIATSKIPKVSSRTPACRPGSRRRGPSAMSRSRT